jgi:WD40 repeat protein
VTASLDGSLRVWHLSTVMEGHESILSPPDTARSRPAAAWADACPDGRFVGLYNDGRMRLWDERHSTSRPASTVMRAHRGQADGGGEPVSCAASRDGLHVATFGGGSEGCVKVWDVRSLVEPVGVMYMGEGSYGEGGGVISFNPRYSRLLAVSGVPRGDAILRDSRDSGPSKKRRGEEVWGWWGQEDEGNDDDDEEAEEEEEQETVSETQEEDDDDQEEERARKRKRKLKLASGGTGSINASGGGGRDTAVRAGHVQEGTVTIADHSKGKMTSVARLRLCSGQSTCVEWNSDGSQLACGTSLGLTHVFFNPLESRGGVASISM